MSAVAEQLTFEDRLKARIKDSIGELMSDADLKKIVDRGVEEVFFKERRTVRQYGADDIRPALIHEIIKELLAERMRAAVGEWIKANADKIVPVIEKTVREGAGAAVLAAVSARFEGDLADMGQNIISRLTQR